MHLITHNYDNIIIHKLNLNQINDFCCTIIHIVTHNDAVNVRKF